MTDVVRLLRSAPVDGLAMVSADQETILGNGTSADPLRTPHPDPNFFPVRNNSSSIIRIGAPVTASGQPGDASIFSLSFIVGLALIDTEPGDLVLMQGAGALSLSQVQWDVVSGGSGGLIAGARYFLGLVAGMLSTIAPVSPGEGLVAVGIAVSATTMIVGISPSILL